MSIPNSSAVPASGVVMYTVKNRRNDNPIRIGMMVLSCLSR